MKMVIMIMIYGVRDKNINNPLNNNEKVDKILNL